MKHTVNFILLVLFSLLFVCCGDDDDSYVYKKSHFVSGKVRMFTQNGEVKDELIIQKYTNRTREFFLNKDYSSGDVYSFDDDIKVFDDYDAEFIFDAPNNGIVVGRIGNYAPVSLGFTMKQKDGYSTISLNDTLNTYMSHNADYNTLIYKCRPYYIDKVSVMTSSGYTDRVTYLRPLYIKKTKGEIRLYFTSFMQSSYYGSQRIRTYISGPTNNMINEEYLKKLRDVNENGTDTIAYKESYIVFR